MSEKKYQYTISINIIRHEYTTIKETDNYGNRGREADMETGSGSVFDVKRRSEELADLVEFAKDALDLI